jgi:hypothetical protein
MRGMGEVEMSGVNEREMGVSDMTNDTATTEFFGPPSTMEEQNTYESQCIRIRRAAKLEERVNRVADVLTHTRAVISSGKPDERMARHFDIELPEIVNTDRVEETHVGTSVTPSVFRFDGGEELDYDEVIFSTSGGGKDPRDMDVPENPTPRQYALKAIFDAKALDEHGTSRRKYQVGGWEPCTESPYTREWNGNQVRAIEVGVYHYYWLKVPKPANNMTPRVEWATQWAQHNCKPAGVKNMVKALLNFWDQGITHLRVMVMPQAYTIPDSDTVVPAHPASAFHRYEVFHAWPECQLDQRKVRAAFRAMRAATSAQYVDDQAKVGEYDVSDQEEVTW